VTPGVGHQRTTYRFPQGCLRLARAVAEGGIAVTVARHRPFPVQRHSASLTAYEKRRAKPRP